VYNQNLNLKFEECVNIYSNVEERITHLGSVFHNKISRNMWILLSHNSQILENEKNPRLPIYEHHIKNMIKSGIVSTSQKMHNKHKTTFYRAAPITVIASSPHYENLNQNNDLKNLFLQSFKL